MANIPIIDLQTTADLPAAFAQAYGETGFAYVTGHGVPDSLIAAMFDVSARFHALPLVEKMALQVDKTHRGYIPIDSSTDVTSTLAKVTKPNQSASLMLMRDDAVPIASEYLSGPNKWPDLPGFRTVAEAYTDAMTDLGNRLMRIALQACGADLTAMQAFARPTTWLRLLHYPAMPDHSPDDLYGSAPHTDFGCLTLLAQDDVGGLQVMTPAGDWIDAPRLPGSFVVNVGDMLHRMSNGALRSTPHRVINRSGRERYSCPFFYDCNVNTVVAPLPGTTSAACEPKFEPILFADFLRSQLQATYKAHQAK